MLQDKISSRQNHAITNRGPKISYLGPTVEASMPSEKARRGHPFHKASSSPGSVLFGKRPPCSISKSTKSRLMNDCNFSSRHQVINVVLLPGTTRRFQRNGTRASIRPECPRQGAGEWADLRSAGLGGGLIRSGNMAICELPRRQPPAHWLLAWTPTCLSPGHTARRVPQAQ